MHIQTYAHAHKHTTQKTHTSHTETCAHKHMTQKNTSAQTQHKSTSQGPCAPTCTPYAAGSSSDSRPRLAARPCGKLAPCGPSDTGDSGDAAAAAAASTAAATAAAAPAPGSLSVCCGLPSSNPPCGCVAAAGGGPLPCTGNGSRAPLSPLPLLCSPFWHGCSCCGCCCLHRFLRTELAAPPAVSRSLS